MSAWYVFATIGLYPLVPSTGTYVLVPPSVRRTVLRQPGGAPTVIEVADGSTGAYVASVTVDGSPWTSVSIPHEVVVAASRIVFTLSEEPTGWASDTRPVSASEVHGYRDVPVDLLPVGASPLTDDTGRTVRVLSPGETLSVPTPGADASLVTVTVAEPGTYSWRTTLGTGSRSCRTRSSSTRGRPGCSGPWRGGTCSRSPRMSSIPLTQLELIAADGQR